MARKTKAELAAEREEALAAQEAHEFAQSPSRLMAALELATSLNYELTVENAKFRVRNYNERAEYYMTAQHTRASQDTLQELEWELEQEQEHCAEQDRKTGEWYNPQEAFDRMMNKPEIQAVFKRLAVR